MEIPYQIVRLVNFFLPVYDSDLSRLEKRSFTNYQLSISISCTKVDSSGATMSGGCPSQFTACALTSIISDGTLDTRIEHLREVYSHRARAYLAAIKRYWVPYGVQCNPCVGGYFLWIRLPDGLTAAEVFNEAVSDGVWIMEGTNCMVPSDTSVEYDKFIRICIALEEEDNAVEGIRRLGNVFERLTKGKALQV
jgi:DNA-binding transcriptional MocR family regulator